MGPSLAVGDLSATLGAHEQHEGGLPNPLSHLDFHNCIDDYNNFQMPSTSLRFSWALDRDNLGYMQRNLDRAFCNARWIDNWAIANYHVFSKMVSNHSPLIICGLTTASDCLEPFRFQSM
ncbi:Endonuclease/exonuclease/phosphatase family protein [Melia azedarach]|uniref:Endonuclease/exonuclease/phosphatase family protein n=1 Tax=Melia azedarach TaxID=155640 RepID=A0ACC1Y5Q9_MELAZ|nr:Endonuclease/exonuclease/phosphatase family protein [Melia azedarach]